MEDGGGWRDGEMDRRRDEEMRVGRSINYYIDRPSLSGGGWGVVGTGRYLLKRFMNTVTLTNHDLELY